MISELAVFRKFGSEGAQRPRPRNHCDGSWAVVDVILIRGGDANICVRPLKTLLLTTPYVNPDAMVHVLLTLNEPLLQRSRPRGPLGLSLTTIQIT